MEINIRYCINAVFILKILMPGGVEAVVQTLILFNFSSAENMHHIITFNIIVIFLTLLCNKLRIFLTISLD